MTREGRILELGTFTGYGTCCLLEGAINAGEATGLQAGSRTGGPYVLSLERDSKAFDVAAAHLGTVAALGFGEDAAEALAALTSRGEAAKSIPALPSDTVSFLSSGIALCELVRVSDALASVEAMAAGLGEVLPAPFDMVFVDADKTRLYEYVDACLSSNRLLKRGGTIVVDNVLWKGLVLEARNGRFTSVDDADDSGSEELRRNRRARKMANKMHRFNAEMVKDSRADVQIVPIRDGLSVIRKR
jgi:predicted O-methyltransferase YrrM